VVSLLYRHLIPFDDLVPVAVKNELQKKALTNSQLVLSLVGKLLQLQQSFTESGIPLAIFKGPVLSQIAYSDLALRPAGDIDVLISRDDFRRARKIINSLGYKMTPSLSAEQLRSHFEFHCEIPFVSADSATVVDLHWGLAPASFVLRLNTPDLMSRLQRVAIAGISVQTFGNEDLVLYLAMHGAKHLWRWLEWISSLAEVVRHSPSLDWEQLIKLAVTTHTTRMLALGLRLAEHCFQAPLPPEVLATIDSRNSTQQLAEEIRANILYWPVNEPESTETALYNLKIMDRRTDAFISMLRAMYTPTLSDFQAVTLPSSLHALYYAIRPIRLSKSYSVRFLRKLSGRSDVARDREGLA
jgi:hypothetical protein